MDSEKQWPIVDPDYWLEDGRAQSWCRSCGAWLPTIVYLAEQAYCAGECMTKSAALSVAAAAAGPTKKPTKKPTKAKKANDDQLAFDM